jgi:hypothetical protein
MMGGLFWADARESSDLFDWINTTAQILPGNKSQMMNSYLIALESMTTERTGDLFHKIERDLPSDVPYLSVTGILPDNGKLTVKNSMKAFVDGNSLLNIAKGANDGFMEYPRTAIPTSYSSRVYNIPVNGSHMIIDGYIDAYSLRIHQNEQAFYYGLLKFILDHRMKHDQN